MGDIFSTGLTTFAAAEAEASGPMGIAGVAFYLAIVLILLFTLLTMAKKGLKQRVFQNFWTSRFEQLYLFIEGMCVNIIGGHGRKYVPFIITFWLMIFFGNIVALFFPYSPTADLSFNLGMALISIMYVQWEGMKSNGILGHFGHFAGPKLGGVMALMISPVIFCIEIVSEMMKNLSLSLRLYGNIHGGHQAVEAMNSLGTKFYVPVGEFLLPIKLLTVVVQAMIFTLLTCVYLSLVTHHEEHHDEHAHADEPVLAHA
jgi:F-type H+-transporting ATPase subunit a